MSEKYKTITVELEPPIVAYCPECNWVEKNEYGGYLAFCPICKTKIKSFVHSKDFSRVQKDSSSRSYNLLDPSDKRIQYLFFIPGESTKSILVEEEYAFDIQGMTPFEVAHDLLEVFKEHYLYTSNEKKIREIKEILEKREEKDEKKKREYDIKITKDRLYCLLIKEEI